MIAICTPSRDVVQATFTYDLVQLVQHMPAVLFTIALGTTLPNLRTSLVRRALSAQASHILFLDSDMRFPADTLDRLLPAEAAIIGANCQQRTQQHTTARVGDQFVSSQDRIGRQTVETLGFGVTLIRADVFSRIPEPWFGMPFDGDKYVGEDVFFCHRAREAGLTIQIDHDLSQLVKHTGSVEF